MKIRLFDLTPNPSDTCPVCGRGEGDKTLQVESTVHLNNILIFNFLYMRKLNNIICKFDLKNKFSIKQSSAICVEYFKEKIKK